MNLPALFTAYGASFVECVEALSIVLAVGVTRGWSGALQGALAGLALLAGLVVVLGPSLALIPVALLQLVVGGLLLWLGSGWWRKAVRRLAGIIPRRDEAAAYTRYQREAQAAGAGARSRDWIGSATAFKAVMLEGTEVVIIVLGLGAGGAGLAPAAEGALLAAVSVAGLGVVLRAPLTRVPQNALKLGVGSVLVGFGLFWLASGAGLAWPARDLALPVIVLAVLVLALALGHWLRGRAVRPRPRVAAWAVLLVAWVAAALLLLPLAGHAGWAAPLFALVGVLLLSLGLRSTSPPPAATPPPA